MEADPVIEIERRIRLSLVGRGRDASHNLPWLATDALVAGFDSPSLRDLAGRSVDEHSEDLIALLRDSASELGIEEPAGDDAYLLALYDVCLRVVRGELPPVWAADEVYWSDLNDERFVDSYTGTVMQVIPTSVALSVASMEEYANVEEYKDEFVRAVHEFVNAYESGPIERVVPLRPTVIAAECPTPPRGRRWWRRWLRR